VVSLAQEIEEDKQVTPNPRNGLGQTDLESGPKIPPAGAAEASQHLRHLRVLFGETKAQSQESEEGFAFRGRMHDLASLGTHADF
jgi:hypothetical protein